MSRREHPIPATGHVPITRRTVIGGLGLALGGILAARPLIAQESTPESTPGIESIGAGEMPTYGGLRPGPVGQEPPETTSNAAIPMTIAVEAAGIDAEIEQLDIVDGRMLNPTGPWVVAWYRQGGALGEPGNVLLAGHVDYWGVGPSVFYNVRDLVAGDEVVLTGENGKAYRYVVTTNVTYAVEELVSGRMAELVAPTESQVVTMFTCGGEFDYVNGEYLSRTVVQADRVREEPPSSTPEG
jgi:hypothetical protein